MPYLQEFLDSIKFRCKPTEAVIEKTKKIAEWIWDHNDNLFYDDFDFILFVETTSKHPEGVVKLKVQKKECNQESLVFPDGESFEEQSAETKSPMKHIPWAKAYDNIFEHGPLKGPETEVWLKGEK